MTGLPVLFAVCTATPTDDHWLGVRQALIRSIWGVAGPPHRSQPDHIAPTNVSGVTRLEWDISSKYLPMTATVFHRQSKLGQRTSSAILQHHSHEWGNCRHPSCDNGTRCDRPSCTWWDNEGVMDLVHNDLARLFVHCSI